MVKTTALICGTSLALMVHFNKETPAYAGKLPQAHDKLAKFLGSLGLSETDLDRSLSTSVQRWKSVPVPAAPSSISGKEKKDKKEKVEKKEKGEKNKKEKGGKKTKGYDHDDDDDAVPELPSKRRRCSN